LVLAPAVLTEVLRRAPGLERLLRAQGRLRLGELSERDAGQDRHGA
jgi:hypothetical protein